MPKRRNAPSLQAHRLRRQRHPGGAAGAAPARRPLRRRVAGHRRRHRRARRRRPHAGDPATVHEFRQADLRHAPRHRRLPDERVFRATPRGAARRRPRHRDPSAADARARRHRPHATATTPSTKCRCSARPTRRRGCASWSTARSGSPSSWPTASCWRPRPARPPTIFRCRGRSSRSMRRCWRSRRSARSGRGAGAARCCPTAPRVTIEVLEAEKRPVAAVADHDEVRSVSSVDISMDHSDRHAHAVRSRPQPRRTHPARAIRVLTTNDRGRTADMDSGSAACRTPE